MIATRVLAPLTAIILAAFLNMLGATQISGVAQTIATGLVDPKTASQVMVLCALVGAILWNFATWFFGVPSSSSYALVGGLIGASWVAAGPSAVIWQGLFYKVVIPMFLSPIGGFFLAYLVMKGLVLLLKSAKWRKRVGIFAHLQVASASLVALFEPDRHGDVVPVIL